MRAESLLLRGARTVPEDAKGRAVIQVEDARFPELLRRVAALTPAQAKALRMLATDGGAVDVRRIARHCGVTRTVCTDAMRGLAMQGLVSYDAGKWRFAFRGARRV